jgi:anti-sigma-K factor RskA
MIDERREAQASLYVLGILPEEEAREFEAVLRGDFPLQMLVRDLRDATAAMAAAFPRVAPPPELREAVLAAVGGAPAAVPPARLEGTPWFVWMPWALAACFALLCLVLLSWGYNFRQDTVARQREFERKAREVAELRSMLAATDTEFARIITNLQERVVEGQRQIVEKTTVYEKDKALLQKQIKDAQTQSQRDRATFQRELTDRDQQIEKFKEALAITPVPDRDRLSRIAITVLGPTPDAPNRAVTGAAVWDPDEQRGLLLIENLPPAGAADYQLWLFDPRYPVPVSAGVLQPDPAGRTRNVFRSLFRVENLTRMAISVEAKGGSDTPKGKIILASN